MEERIIIKITYNKIGRPGKRYILKCLHCSKKFELPGFQFNEGKGKYCTLKCANISDRRLNKLRKSLMKLNRRGKNNSNWKDGRSFYQKYRKKSCEMCEQKLRKGKRTLLVHHRDGDRTNASIDNLQTLCYSCHSITHGKHLYPRDKHGRYIRRHTIP